MRADGKELTSKRALLPQNGDTVVSLTTTIREMGEHAGEIVVSGAPPAAALPVALKGDDRFFFVVRVVDKLSIAIVNGQSDLPTSATRSTRRLE